MNVGKSHQTLLLLPAVKADARTNKVVSICGLNIYLYFDKSLTRETMELSPVTDEFLETTLLQDIVEELM